MTNKKKHFTTSKILHDIDELRLLAEYIREKGTCMGNFLQSYMMSNWKAVVIRREKQKDQCDTYWCDESEIWFRSRSEVARHLKWRLLYDTKFAQLAGSFVAGRDGQATSLERKRKRGESIAEKRG